MKFISIDIETTGLCEKSCQVIEVAAVIDDALEPMGCPPEFHCYVTHPIIQGDPYALSMHAEIFKRMATREYGHRYEKPQDVGPLFGHWLGLNSHLCEGDKWTVTGKNYAGFDDRFLRCLPYWNCNGLLRHRVLDPGSLYFDPRIDTMLPGTKECMKRAGLEGEVAHTALEDAKVVAKLIQHYYLEIA